MSTKSETEPKLSFTQVVCQHLVSSHIDNFTGLTLKQHLLSLWPPVSLKPVKGGTLIPLISKTTMLITTLLVIEHITGREASHSLQIYRTNNKACVLKEGETRENWSEAFMDRPVLSGSGDSPWCN